MNKGFKYEYTELNWEYNMEHFDRWCKGQTGYPIGESAAHTNQSLASLAKYKGFDPQPRPLKSQKPQYTNSHILD